MNNLIDWVGSEKALSGLDGWIGDVPFFRIYLGQRPEVAVLHNLTQLGFDAETDKEFSYRKISGFEHFSIDSAKAEAEKWFQERILDRMELIKNPKLLAIGEALNSLAGSEPPVTAEEGEEAWVRFQEHVKARETTPKTAEELLESIKTLIDDQVKRDRARQLEHARQAKARRARGGGQEVDLDAIPSEYEAYDAAERAAVDAEEQAEHEAEMRAEAGMIQESSYIPDPRELE